MLDRMIGGSTSSTSCCGVTPLTVPCVPTGMKIGVGIVPWSVWINPALARVTGHSAWISNRTAHQLRFVRQFTFCCVLAARHVRFR